VDVEWVVEESSSVDAESVVEELRFVDVQWVAEVPSSVDVE